jgi:hypothetical protein
LTDCDTVLDAPPEERQRHLAGCPECARLYRAMQLAAAPEPAPLSTDFFLKLDMVQDRPDPIELWTRTVQRVRQALTVAAALTAVITTGWVAHGVPEASRLSDQQIERTLEWTLRQVDAP